MSPSTGLRLTSFARLAEDADWLRRFLASRPLEIVKGSRLDEALLALSNLPLAQPGMRPPKDVVQALGAAYLSRLLQRVDAKGLIPAVSRLLPALVAEDANPLPTVTAESTKARNDVFELEVCATLLAAGLDAKLAEPDVVVEYGGLWRLAAKVLYSASETTLMDRIEEGVSQALGRSGDKAMVVVGVSNRLKHSDFLPLLDPTHDIWGSYSPPDLDALAQSALAHFEKIVVAQAPTRLVTALADTRFRGVMLVAHTVAGLRGVPATVTAVRLVSRSLILGQGVMGPEYDLARRFFDVTQSFY